MDDVISSPTDYSIMYSIGRGATSEVFYARHNILNLPVAIKGIPKSLLIADKWNERFNNEIEALKRIDNEYISSLYDFFSDENNYYFVIDLAENGSFESIVQPGRPCTENNAKKYFSQLLSALSYIHNVHHIIHRDIKAGNILLDQNFNIKLIDFGMCNLYDPKGGSLLSAVGSPAYMPPELILGEGVTQKSDLWSAGVFLYFITAGKLPFYSDDISKLFHDIVNFEQEYPTYLSGNLQDLLSMLMEKDSSRRPSIPEIASHSWLANQHITLYDGDQNGATPDMGVVEKMSQMGIDVHGLEDMIRDGKFNKKTAMYRILKSSLSRPSTGGRLSLGGLNKLKIGAGTQMKFKSMLEQSPQQKIITTPVIEKQKKGNFMGLKGANIVSHRSNISVMKKLPIL